MVTVSFPNWSDALAAADLPPKVRDRHRVIIKWYLGHLKREHQPVTVATAREFVEQLVEERKPEKWQVDQWGDGLNWFFREAPTRRHRTEMPVGGRRSPEGAGCRSRTWCESRYCGGWKLGRRRAAAVSAHGGGDAGAGAFGSVV